MNSSDVPRGPSGPTKRLTDGSLMRVVGGMTVIVSPNGGVRVFGSERDRAKLTEALEQAGKDNVVVKQQFLTDQQGNAIRLQAPRKRR